ncbi:oxidoreductase [Rhodospirillum rubrum]|uniref:proton-conducting transporter transmembrane domain-containing protein n=1 Tax=Rhodospirillum rubrum TaxID=1085 RepID=UPI001905D012|nr:proton-conducting transporter membrane subunit [Rhodospirillum rubrum]MBK1662909.1 oxidoreductase [Rhodospirillum rubrum]MBK1677095.1 oxidoreductase [Rhodospirillum rubrum]
MADISALAWAGAALMLIGEGLALRNVRDLARMLTYSTIAEIGYVLMGLGIGTAAGETGAVMHLGYQAIMRALVVVAAWHLIRRTGSSKLDALVGSVERMPFVSLMFGFGLFSVMGLSPFKGSFSKFVILYAAIENGYWGLAAVGTIASIIAAFYYIHTIQQVCFQRQSHGILGDKPIPFFQISAGQLPIVVLALVTVVMSLDPDPFLMLAANAVGLPDHHGLPEFETIWDAPVLLPYVGGFALFVFGRFSAKARAVGAIALATATLALVAVRLQVGDLGGLFALIFAAIGLAVTVYSVGYMKHGHGVNRYFFFLFLMIGSLIGVATTNHLGNFYLFWELMTWMSYLLVIHEQTAKALKAGMKYFLICASGAYVMHFGILVLHAQLGTFEISEIAPRIGTLSPALAGVVLATFLIGFMAKAGLFPLHSWLPEAHPVAPSSISGPMSGILTKAGILGMVKLLFGIFGVGALGQFGLFAGLSLPGAVLVGLGGITLLLGEVQAYRQTDIKRLLAYSTLAQIGEITMVLGVGTSLALAGGLFHVTNHAVMKTMLFFAVGALILRSAGRNLDDLKGLGKVMPFTGLCLGIGLLAIMGVPPFGGFVSKFLMIYACVEAGQVGVAAVILVGSVIGALYYARVLRAVFFEPYRGPKVVEAPLTMRIALGALAGVVVFNGLYPDAALSVVMPVVETLSARGGLPLAALPPLRMEWSLAALIAVVGAVVVYILGKRSTVVAGSLSVAVMALALAGILIQSGRYDLLSFWFAALIVVVGAINLLYSIGYMAHGHAQNRFFFFFVMMIGGLLGVTASDDLFNFFAFWEVMSSWTLYLVIIHEETKESLDEGTKYFVFNFVCASFLFLGVAILAAKAGTFEMALLPQAALSMPVGWLAVSAGLILAGLLMKAAQLPLRIDYQMHPAPAPTPVSGYISAVLLKVGPYGVLKMMVALGAGGSFARIAGLGAWMPDPLAVVQVIAALTVLYAGAMAVVQNGVKRLLIYSTVSQLGYVLLGLSLGSALGVAGGLMHFVNHMMLKDILFLAAGCILAQAHVHSLDDLGGLGRKMPITFGLFLFAGLSLSGIPPFNGFASKWLIYQGAFQGGHYLLAMAALMSSLFTLAAVLKFTHSAFLGPLSPAAATMREAPPVMLIPMGLLAAGSVIVGVFPGVALVPISRIQAALGLPAIEASWLGGLPGPGGWHPLTLTLALGAVGLIGWLYCRDGYRQRAASTTHSCGVSDIAASAMHVPASGLYETPDRLIRKVLFAKTSPEGRAHD